MRYTEVQPDLMLRDNTTLHKLDAYKLIAFDMDSTLINIECIDEIADAAGSINWTLTSSSPLTWTRRSSTSSA